MPIIDIRTHGGKYAGIGAGGIKSIQRGLSIVSYDKYTLDVTISNVDPNKCLVFAWCVTDYSYGQRYNAFQAYLTSATNLRLDRHSRPYDQNTSYSWYNVAVSWIVIEFTNVKSKQEGTVSIVPSAISDAGDYHYWNVSISSVNPSKCIVALTYKSTEQMGNDASTYWSAMNGIYLLNNTTLQILVSSSQNYTQHYRWQVLEFN
ncbi:hypothetical protein MX569_10895 [Anoxybacillus kestanbolensis]|uniref:hypothetical protein n=1 Tax=Anoxybacillus kestanbolensis TaxID=227476 RepID=UPI00208DBAF9|nr:hypothetical protein [Anoxybacillus kestanbolensis]MCL9971092.1 hypothetical protein [Anoxybacillus kestanbolensis]